MEILKAIAASPGIAIGKVFLLNAKRIKTIKRKIRPEEISNEKERFERAVCRIEDQLKQLISELPEEIKEHSNILKSHILMLRDKMVYDKSLQLIETRQINGEWALELAMEEIKALFSTIKDSYIRERLEDIGFVVNKVKAELAGTETRLDLSSIEEPVIIVARNLSPADTLHISKEKVLGFVTELGSRTSHTAILARSLGIPAVVGLDDITSKCLSGEMIIVDGLLGQVVVEPDQQALNEYSIKQEKYLAYRLEVIHNSNLPAETTDGYRIKVKANMELVEEIPIVIQHGAEGVGLFRTEFLYMTSKTLPTEDQLFLAYKEVVERLKPYPVTIRTLDIGGDKLATNLCCGEEINPALGLRAIRFCLHEKGLFRAQLRAILRASAFGDLRLLFPMVSGKSEMIQVKRLLNQIMDELEAEGLEFNRDIKIGIMIEVPTAVLTADILAREADFFSIGTNDLIQYSLAIDRVNEAVCHLYEPLHPGVLRMIKMTVDSGHREGIEVGMCGEMAGEPLYIPILLGIGLDELSMNAMAIPKTKKIIRQSNQEECSRFVSELLSLDSARLVKEKAIEFFRTNYPPDMETTDFLEFGQNIQ